MPALMGVSFVAILLFGKRMPKQGSEIGNAAVGLSFVFAVISASAWITHVNDASHVTAPPEQTTQGAETGTNAPAEGENAAEVGVGLAIVLMLYRNRASIDLDEVDAMRG